MNYRSDALGQLIRQRARYGEMKIALDVLLEIVRSAQAKCKEDSAEWRLYQNGIEIADKALAQWQEDPQ